MPIKTQSAKSKARILQNHIRDRILMSFSWLEEGDFLSRSMGAAGTDVYGSPLGRQTLPLSIECKKTKKTPSRAELQQSRENQDKGTTPAVVWCPHGCGPDKSIIMFDFEDFLNFYKEVASERLERIREKYE